MFNTTSNKRKLLQGASALILGSVSVTATAQTVTTTTTTITPTSTDALIRDDKSRTADTTATVNNANDKSGGSVDVTSSSVVITGSSTTAVATQNTSAATITDASEAATATSAGIVVEQDNTANALARIGTDGAEGDVDDGTEVKVTTATTLNSPLTISGTLNRATATGNAASTMVNESDFASNATSAFSAARQQNTGATGDGNKSITATVNDTDINITSGITTGSALTVSGSTDAAVATANSLTQRMTLDGTSLTLGSNDADINTTPSGESEAGVADVDAIGKALLSSRQTNTFTDVSASNSASSVTINAGVTNGSSLDLTTNVQDATATGSTAANVMAVSGTTVGTGVGIVSSQTSDAQSSVAAATTGKASITAASLGTTTASSASLTDNALQSRATGGSVSNTLTASATTITLQTPDGLNSADISRSDLTSDTSLSGAAYGAYATLNDQLIAGDVTATTNATGSADAGFTVRVTGQVSNGSSINNDRNAMTAQAQGAVAANTTTLAVGGTLSLATVAEPNLTGVANAAVIANIQELADGADILARVDTTSPDPSVLTSVGGALDNSSVSTSNNRVQAFADGASATNALTASATTLTADTAGGAPGYANSIANSAFTVFNRQDGGNATVRAELNDPIPLRTQITGNSSNSSVDSTGNMQDAFATSNKSTNSLALSATTLTTDGVVVNNQNSDAQVLTVIGGTTSISGGGVITQAPGAVGANAGVVVDFDGSISNNAVAVTGNIVRGSAISNVATNTLTASATTLAGDGTDANAFADVDSTETRATFALANSQTLDTNAASVTGVFATYGVDVAFDQAVTNSQIAVSNNTQFGEALGNSATNRLQLTAVGAGVGVDDPTSAVNNVQMGVGASIVATSNMDLYANMASSGSTIEIEGNRNTALGAVNNASNTLSVSGLTVDGNDSQAIFDPADAERTAATYAINSFQQADGNLTSSARTTANNLDRTDTTTVGIQNGSASLSNNTTTAEASANRVANSVSFAATNSTATAAIGNEQNSDTDTSAVANGSSYRIGLAAEGEDDVAYAANGSSIALDGNTTSALARGNSATNDLNYTVDVTAAGYTGFAGALDDGYAQAGALVGNIQSNSGNLEASANSVSYSEDLVQGNAGSLLNSQASLDNNTTSAAAFGNSGTNRLTVAATNSTTSAAINNVQENEGNVSANTNAVGYSFNLTAPTIGETVTPGTGYAANGSSISLDDNTSSALASGNSSTNALNYTVDVAAGGYTGIASASASASTDRETTAGASVLNAQSNNSGVAAFATSVSYTETVRAGAIGSLLNSQTSLDNNTTSAAAFGNSGTNSLNVAATDGSISAALNNVQSNAGSVFAVAAGDSYGLALTGSGTGYAANASSMSVAGNTTTAVARGNAATNTLNYTVGVSYSGFTTDPTATVGDGAITGTTAGALILNAQTNTQSVDAVASDNSYAVTLAAGTSGSVLNSQVSLANNTTNALAFGNSATNTLTMATYRNGIPSSAIATNQVNSGAVTASASSVAYTMTPSGFVSGSALRNSGNSVSAQAIGNNSVSTIGGGN
jgi:hypothetical protein